MESNMSMFVRELDFNAPPVSEHKGLLKHFHRISESLLTDDAVPVRFVVTSTTASGYHCELGSITGLSESKRARVDSIFEFRPRPNENAQQFNVVLMIPTGIGAEIGGHAGDAAPVARMLGASCDILLTHPNAVNASDLNEMSENTLYVEGSVLCRLLMGTLGLQRVRSNRLLAVIDSHDDQMFVHLAINSINAARATLGLDCSHVVQLDPSIKLLAEYSDSGTAIGRIESLERLLEVLDTHRPSYDAVAISSVITVPPNFHMDYFRSEGAMINPWGGVEAMLTHSISTLYNVPSAHSPMMESQEIANADPGIVDPRMSAEAVSNAFLHCILKGLSRSPKIVRDPVGMWHHSVITAADISCLVIPDGCLGLPTLAALEQGIKVVAVRENSNLMRNDLTSLPWAQGQFYRVENYWEAAGVLMAIKAGIPPNSVRRPMQEIEVTKTTAESESVCHSVSIG
jgi:hypothetical protein